MRSGMRNVVVGLGMLLLLGCAGLGRNPGVQPKVIVVRNSTTAEIYNVILSESVKEPGRSSRYGEISPVPSGVSQQFVRSDNAPRLPRHITVSWKTTSGREMSQDLDIGKQLKRARGIPDAVLVFEIVSFGRAKALIENGVPLYQ